ncbi:phage coat protein [Salmonella enterica]|nr:phage coat protein [Salmonella enterica]
MNKLISVKNAFSDRLLAVSIAVGLSVVPVVSFAADATGTDAGTQAFDNLQQAASTYISKAWVVFGVIVGAAVAMKLVKKFINKAS